MVDFGRAVLTGNPNGATISRYPGPSPTQACGLLAMDVFLNRHTQRVRENTRELSHEKNIDGVERRGRRALR
ncbi:MAG: hypothetical protein VYB89_05000, partial [Pseudomonadota bacterium]|nr:hypothetical protein [Pseudomonadota bacterium]